MGAGQAENGLAMAVFRQVERIVVGGDAQGRRLDNWLFSHYKNIPKGRIYRAIRRGEVRINGRRAKAADKLMDGHEVRIPPWYQNQPPPQPPPPLKPQTIKQLQQSILYENEHLLVIDKPAGWPVHGGHHRQCGLSEALSRWRSSDDECLTPAHRLDRETSGCLIFARSKAVVLALHQAFRQRQVHKTYVALLSGQWHHALARVECPLSLSKQSPRKRVVVAEHNNGKAALSWFKPIRQFSSCSLVQVETHSGRMHQIRVHAAYHQRPLVGERHYSSAEQRAMNAHLRARRLCLHASCISFTLYERHYCFIALLPQDFTEVLRTAML